MAGRKSQDNLYLTLPNISKVSYKGAELDNFNLALRVCPLKLVSTIYSRDMSKTKFFSALCAGLFMITGAVTPSAYAQSERQIEGIAAVVNDDIITLTDLFSRINLTILSANLPKNEETQRRIAPQVLRGLIDESLKLQKADEYNISISDEDIAQGVETIASRNQMSAEQFAEFLSKNGTNIRTIRQQVKATLSWNKVVENVVVPTVSISDDEVDQFITQLSQSVGNVEFELSEIFLGMDSAQQEQALYGLANRLVQEIQNGANFRAIASQFSQSANAATGGDLGWVPQGSLDPEIEAVALSIKPGQVSKPIRTFDGYHIIVVRNKRIIGGANPMDVMIDYVQVVERPSQTDTKDSFKKRLQKFASETKSCDAFEEKYAASESFKSGEKVRIGSFDAELAQRLIITETGRFAPPLVTPDGVVLTMVCDKDVKSGNLPSSFQVKHNLSMQQVDLKQRRMMRDIRRDAFVDIRL